MFEKFIFYQSIYMFEWQEWGMEYLLFESVRDFGSQWSSDEGGRKIFSAIFPNLRHLL